MAENADIRAFVRDAYARKGVLVCKAAKAVSGPTKFEQYYDYSEPVAKIPSHRFLAVRRGEAEGVLRSHIEVAPAGLRERAARVMGLNDASPFGELMRKAIEDGYRRLLSTSVQIDVGANLKSRSDAAAVQIFADNLRHLLLASPLGAKPVIGIDPGFRTGCKCAAVDATGELLEHSTLYMHTGEAKAAQAEAELVALVERNRPVAVAVGNGTAGRDTEAFVRRALATAGHRHVAVVSVSEAGASVYSASEVGREELPELDLTVRGAVSIARRLQDPLAELVKIEPRSIGVGQYQHDVAQSLLERKLGEVVESCVNHVGVEINTASAPLLSYVAGLRGSLAKRIVEYRQQHGAFRTRSTLLKVAGLGPRTFEQAAGFLRIRGGAHPLDASAVHPERYAVVERMAQDLNVTVTELVGNAALVEQIDIARYANEEVGLGVPTLRDILSELEKPGRDPRAHFEPPRFRDDVHSIEDLEEGMLLQGVVTNVTAFGAFVDVGVHQDGLVHISELADRFVRDPREVAKVGDRLTVRVLSVDGERKRIGLSARLKADRGRPGRPAHRRT